MNHDILSEHKTRSVTGIEISLSDMLMRSPMLDRERQRQRDARNASRSNNQSELPLKRPYNSLAEDS